MADSNNIQQFTAADIEKYHQGLLSAKERHDLEKAALDDPFLADALEGYAVAGVDAKTDIEELSKRLAKRTDDKKIIPVTKVSGRSIFLRIAAMIILVAGAALLVYQFGFNKKSEENIAQTIKPTQLNKPVADTQAAINPAIVAADSVNASTKKSFTVIKPAKRVITSTATGSGAVKKDSLIPVYYYNQDDETSNAVVTNNDAGKPAIAPQETLEQNAKKEAAIADDKRSEMAMANKDFAKHKAAVSSAPTVNNNPIDNGFVNNMTNSFRGRVTDANNNGLPFANVTNMDDNVGTYTDARGYFNLISSDSVLNVQVRSVGFNSNQARLQNNNISNDVIMQEDRTVAAQTLSNKKVNAARRQRIDNFKLQNEPEPEDGWENYDSYLSNNLNIPAELKTKRSISNSVDVSFEVNELGEPVNFKIEKSQCKPCNDEAIRLIKNGPKWKRKAKNERTTVTINF